MVSRSPITPSSPPPTWPIGMFWERHPRFLRVNFNSWMFSPGPTPCAIIACIRPEPVDGNHDERNRISLIRRADDQHDGVSLLLPVIGPARVLDLKHLRPIPSAFIEVGIAGLELHIQTLPGSAAPVVLE